MMLEARPDDSLTASRMVYACSSDATVSPDHSQLVPMPPPFLAAASSSSSGGGGSFDGTGMGPPQQQQQQQSSEGVVVSDAATDPMVREGIPVP